ncbi:12652_t:CDS:1, partial [Acaulospora colombiana]
MTKSAAKPTWIRPRGTIGLVLNDFRGLRVVLRTPGFPSGRPERGSNKSPRRAAGRE